LSHLIGLRVFVPFRVVKLGSRREFILAGVQLKDFISDIVTQGTRWHRGERTIHAEKSAAGQNHHDDPSGLHIHGEVVHFAEFFVLIVIDRHADDVGGFGHAIQPFCTCLGHTLPGGGGFIRVGIDGILGHRRERQERHGGRAGNHL